MIAITSSGNNLKSNVDTRFGRSQHFLIVDEEGNLDKVISNKGVGARRGAGVQAAQTITDEGVDVLITGNIGPNAFSVLQTAGIKVFLSGAVSVEEAFEKWKEGDLSEAQSPTGSSGRGFGRGRGRGGRR